MKALSIKQPWASLIIRGEKDIENRNWLTKYRGPFLIHASKTWDQAGFEFLYFNMKVWIPHKFYHPFGALIGAVDLIDCVNHSNSKWFFGKWGFVLENPRELKEPIPWKGQLGFFEVPDSINNPRGNNVI